jgi:hypothetical protein
MNLVGDQEQVVSLMQSGTEFSFAGRLHCGQDDSRPNLSVMRRKGLEAVQVPPRGMSSTS